MNFETTTTEWTETSEPTELTIESLGPDWTDYTDLGLKALLVIAAFLIAFNV